MKTKSALSYFGSDSEVAAQLASYLDHCNHVTIPFVGGAAILPHLKARAIVANDLHAMVLNFHRTLGGQYGPLLQGELIRLCMGTLSHPDEMFSATQVLQLHEGYATGRLSTPVSPSFLAWAFWAVCWIGRKGKGGTKTQDGMPSVRWTANGGTNASRITAAANDLEAWAKHFKRCEWLNECFRVLLPKVKDQEGCGIYCDAPWVGDGESYLHSFTEHDHRDLATGLDRFENATVVIRYGDDPLIRELYPLDRWTWIDAASRTQANKVRDEVWITRNDRWKTEAAQ